jgi:uncharacterized membrane protein
MPRRPPPPPDGTICRFQLTDGPTKIRDSGGQVLSDASAAREHATACTEAFSRRAAQFNGNEGLYWSVQVVDATGHQVFPLQLGAPARARRSR